MRTTRPPGASVAIAERAVAPDPTTSRLVGSVHPARRSAVVRPWTSVLWAVQADGSSVPRTRVLAAPVAAATGVTVVAAPSATSLSGIVSERPTQVPSSPANASAKPDASTSRRS